MELVIEIPDNEYHQICELRLHNRTFYDDAIRNGTPLPKGHGRLIDAEVFANNVVKYSHQSTKTIGQALSDTPTIIEADKGE